jgi:hypothetical protein
VCELPYDTNAHASCNNKPDDFIWASFASGAIPCGGKNTAGTLGAASYTQTFAYDPLGRLTSAPW